MAPLSSNPVDILADGVGKRPLVIIESPFAGDIKANKKYARACMADAIERGEAPFASHLLYTQPGVLRDRNPEERLLGIQLGFAWGTHAHMIAFYVDLGWSSGMRAAREYWDAYTDIPTEIRSIR